jgi:hypothetical protein
MDIHGDLSNCFGVLIKILAGFKRMDSQRVALQIESFPFIALILRGEHGESSFLGTTVTKPWFPSWSSIVPSANLVNTLAQTP